MSIRIGILGYGNLGKGVECAIKQNDDLELAAVFTRRDPSSVKIQTEGVGVYSVDEAPSFKDKIDVMILCGGSATDLPKQTPEYAKYFNVIDSFDTHARIPEHFANVDAAAKESGHVGIISVGWDPGMFSLNRLYANAILVDGKDYTFWGKGVSQGHSDAIRRIDGVKDARQYTVPVPAALDAVRNGENPDLTTRQKHTRECFVVAEEGADKARIENEIKTMPNYFADYDTTVTFISEEESPSERMEIFAHPKASIFSSSLLAILNVCFFFCTGDSLALGTLTISENFFIFLLLLFSISFSSNCPASHTNSTSMYSTAQPHLGCAGGSILCPTNKRRPPKLKLSSISISVPSNASHVLQTESSPDVIQRLIVFPSNPCSCACRTP